MFDPCSDIIILAQSIQHDNDHFTVPAMASGWRQFQYGVGSRVPGDHEFGRIACSSVHLYATQPATAVCHNNSTMLYSCASTNILSAKVAG